MSVWETGAAAVQLVACVTGAIAVAALTRMTLASIRRSRFRRKANESSGIAPNMRRKGMEARLAAYAMRLSRLIATRAATPFSPSVRAHPKEPLPSKVEKLLIHAGLREDVTSAGYRETCFRLSFLYAAIGFAAGSLFSTELALLAFVCGFATGRLALRGALRRMGAQRADEAERHLPEMLDVVALGLRSGITFDRSFALYGSHFDSEFADSCMSAHRIWSLGLSTREDALRELACSYDCPAFIHAVDSIVRSLHFGTALADILEEAASSVRVQHRSSLQERVAKAPVKMMLPTGALILPAMLLLVMGPVLLELISGFPV